MKGSVLVQSWVPSELHRWLVVKQKRTGLSMAALVRLMLMREVHSQNYVRLVRKNWAKKKRA